MDIRTRIFLDVSWCSQTKQGLDRALCYTPASCYMRSIDDLLHMAFLYCRTARGSAVALTACHHWTFCDSCGDVEGSI